MPKGLKKITLQTLNNSIRSKGLQPKFNGMAPKGPKRVPQPQPPRPSQPRAEVVQARAGAQSTSQGWPSAIQSAALGGTAAVGTFGLATALAPKGAVKGLFVRRGGQPVSPFAEAEIQGVPSSAPLHSDTRAENRTKVGSLGQNIESISMAPVTVGITRSGANPRMWASAHKGNVSVTVEHTEYIRDVSGSALFAPTGLAINPGSPEVFGWLSGLASLFDTYTFQKLEFSYNPQVGTSTNGKVLMTFDPDVLDSVPDTKQEMLESRIQLDAAPWQQSVLKVPHDVLNGAQRYTRSGALPMTADQHLYDVGQLCYTFPGAPVALIGELFVTYQVTFYTPNAATPKYGKFANTAVLGSTAGSAAATSSFAGPLAPKWAGTNAVVPGCLGSFLITVVQDGTNFAGVGGINVGAVTAPNSVLTMSTNYSLTRSVCVYRYVAADYSPIFLTQPTGASTLTAIGIYVGEWDKDVA